mmetsp:Transcript_6528/g.10346  ORF Transcript_6528/g.10346 Transcript_6528/m.10346 type:complete len:334 (-) Transcript_6528:146-1147(-)
MAAKADAERFAKDREQEKVIKEIRAELFEAKCQEVGTRNLGQDHLQELAYEVTKEAEMRRVELWFETFKHQISHGIAVAHPVAMPLPKRLNDRLRRKDQKQKERLERIEAERTQSRSQSKGRTSRLESSRFADDAAAQSSISGMMEEEPSKLYLRLHTGTLTDTQEFMVTTVGPTPKVLCSVRRKTPAPLQMSAEIIEYEILEGKNGQRIAGVSISNGHGVVTYPQGRANIRVIDRTDTAIVFRGKVQVNEASSPDVVSIFEAEKDLAKGSQIFAASILNTTKEFKELAYLSLLARESRFELEVGREIPVVLALGCGIAVECLSLQVMLEVPA